MIEITKDNYKDIDFNGVIISVPREHLKDELTQEFCFNFECAYYTEGKYGYKEPGYSPDHSSFFRIWYSANDMPNGFGFNSTSRLPWDEEYLHFNNVRYYKFNDMIEFCTWYLQQKGREIWIDDGENKAKVHPIQAEFEKNQNKEWIHEKCGTNTPPIHIPEHPSKEYDNQKMTKSEYYGDILKYIEARLGLISALKDAEESKNYNQKQLYLHIVEQRQQEIDEWLNSEV